MHTTREGRLLVILLGALIPIVPPRPIFGWSAIGSSWMGPGMMQGYGRAGTGVAPDRWSWALAMGLGSLAMLAFWGAVIAGAIVGLRCLLGQTPGERSQPNGKRASAEPWAIPRRRYAAGEIDRTTYERMWRELEL